MPENYVKAGSLWLPESAIRAVPLPARPCSRCHTEPRLSGQRWGPRCFAEYRRGERRRRRAAPLTAPAREAKSDTRSAITPVSRQAPIPLPLSPPPTASPSETANVRFWCRQYPFLRIGIPGGGVQFQKGLLETSDPRVIAAVRKNDFYGGIIQEGEQPPPPPPARPTSERPRAYPPIIPRRVAGDWTYPWRAEDT